MNLYANGCSFTHGHWFDPVKSQKTEYAYKGFRSYKPYPVFQAWPEHLTKQFDYVYNHGLGGSGTQRIVRTTINFIDHLQKLGESLDKWIFVIQTSMPNRIEFMGEDNTFNTVDYVYSSDDDVVADVNVNYGYDDNNQHKQFMLADSNSLKQTAISYHMNVINNDHMIYEQLKHVMMLVQYLDSLGVKYLITGMTEDLYHPRCTEIMNHTNKWVRLIARQINSQNIISKLDYPVSKFIYTDYVDPEYYDSCGHPNAKTHKLIAERILTELAERNYI